MNTMVAARVPVEVKEQADGILKNLGSNPTELINKAYAFVLKYQALPGDIPESMKAEDAVRTASPQMIAQLRCAYEGMSLPLSDAWNQKTFKEILAEQEEERYARFA